MLLYQIMYILKFFIRYLVALATLTIIIILATDFSSFPVTNLLFYSGFILPTVLFCTFLENKHLTRSIQFLCTLIPSFLMMAIIVVLVYLETDDIATHWTLGIGSIIVGANVLFAFFFEFIKSKYFNYGVILLGGFLFLFNLYWTLTRGLSEPFPFRI